jgi:hypothetical protein
MQLAQLSNSNVDGRCSRACTATNLQRSTNVDNFVLLWTAGLVSITGNWMLVAVPVALGDRLGPVTLLNVQGVGLVAGGIYVFTALRAAVSGVTRATERTLMPAGRNG